MTNNIRRTLIFGVILFVGIVVTEYILSRSNYEKQKTRTVLEILASDKILSSELYRLFYGLEDDFNFFEVIIKDIINNKRDEHYKTLIQFLNTHPRYFKVRLTTLKGEELLKLVQGRDRQTYERSNKLINLSDQNYFNDLNRVGSEDFYFSSMEANIIEGKFEKPIRPTIRVSKKITLKGNAEALLIFNIDGKRIFQLFEENSYSTVPLKDKALVDHNGQYVASIPLLNVEDYTFNKVRVDEETLGLLGRSKEVQGSLDLDERIVVFTKHLLPRSSEKWYLISIVSKASIQQSLYYDQLTRFFWEILSFTVILAWFWRDEKKRHKEQVVQVLLKERGEFIQNVSHQLKTPLTIINNYLSNKTELSQNRDEIEKEIQHLIKVVDDLLLLTRIDALKKIPQVRENLLEILNETSSMVAAKAKEKQVQIRINVQEELVESIDRLERDVLPDLLKSAFFNILDNALDFSPIGGVVSISIALLEGKAHLQFQDEGPGVAPDLEPIIFQRYSRDTTAGRKGSGLGLAIAKRIIELHDGEIRYVPRKPGACFEVLI